MNEHSYKIIQSIRSVIGEGETGLHEPMFFGNEWLYVKNCIDSSYVSSVGEYVDRFERSIEAFTKAKHAIAVSSGTAALHVALVVAGVKQNDEVLIPGLTFIATANAVSYCGAVPHVVACNEHEVGIDVAALEKYLEVECEIKVGRLINRKTKRLISAIIPMHTFGHPEKMPELVALAKKYNIIVIEDAAESIGSYIGNTHTGLFGLAGIFSFNGNKTITTGGGGAIITNDDQFASNVRLLSTTAKKSHGWEFQHLNVAYNYRMPNINAALGCAQMENLPLIIKKKRELYVMYKTAFSNYEEVEVIEEPIGCTSNYWLQTLKLNKDLSSIRQILLSEINAKKISVRPPWQLINQQLPYINCPSMDMKKTITLANSLLNIPSSVKFLC